MKVLEIDINAFGSFVNTRIRLSEDLNILLEADESKKAALTSFIFAMLFGIEKPKEAEKDDLYTTYLPWQNPEKYGGVMVFEQDDKLYRLTKNFYEKNSYTELFSISDNKKIKDGSEVFREMILGLYVDEDLAQKMKETRLLLEGPVNDGVPQEEKEQKAVLEKISAEVMAESEKLAELEDKGSKVKAPIPYERDAHDYNMYKAKYQQLKKDRAAVKKAIEQADKPKDNVKKAEKPVVTEAAKTSSAPVGLLGVGAVLAVVGIVLLVMGMTVPGAGALGVGVILAIVGVLGLSKNKKAAAEAEAERTRKIAEQENMKVQAERDRIKEKEDLEKKYAGFDDTEKEILEFFSRFGKIEKLSDEDIERQEKKLQADKAERDELRKKIGEQIAEQGEKVLKLRIQLDEEEKIAKEIRDRYAAKREKEAKKFSQNQEMVDRYIQDVKRKRGNISQMKLAMRMAASEMAHNMFEIPLIFDDVFEYLDDERLESTIREACYRKGQKIILCCRNRVEEIIKKMEIEYKLIKIE